MKNTREDDRIQSEQYGLTKLEYFTAAALTGLLANPVNTNKDIGAMAVGLAMECINELNQNAKIDNMPIPPPAPIYDDSDDDLPW